MPEVVATVMDNAHRLLMDAKLLESKGRFQSAVSLAILSLEESGKACLVRWKRQGFITRDITNDLRAGHIPKQRILGAYLFAKAVLDSVFMDEHGNAIEPFDLDAAVEIGAKAGYESGYKMSFYAESGSLDFMKMAGFYVDLNDKLEVISRGGDITAVDAARHIKDAETAFEMAAAPTRLQRGTAAVYEQGAHRKIRRRTRDLHEAFWAAISEHLKSEKPPA
jgi:AbiV family abortive infection protein